MSVHEHRFAGAGPRKRMKAEGAGAGRQCAAMRDYVGRDEAAAAGRLDPGKAGTKHVCRQLAVAGHGWMDPHGYGGVGRAGTISPAVLCVR